MDCYTPATPPTYRRNKERVKEEEEPCFICGKGIKKPRYWARILSGAYICTDALADANPDGDTGYYPIGSDCYRGLPVEAKALIHDTRRSGGI